MHDAGGVAAGERVGDLHRVLQASPIFSRHAAIRRGQRLARDVLHGDEVHALVRPIS